MVTLQQIADAAGVSIETVSRVMNGKLKENRPSSKRRAAAIRELGIKLNYRPHAAARAMLTKRTRQVGLFIRNAADAPLAHLAGYETILGADSRLSQEGYVSCLIRLNDLPHVGFRSRVFSEQVLDGVIAIDELPEFSIPVVKSVAEHCVWVDSSVWEPERCIRRDEFHAATVAVGKLAELGYRRLLWVVRRQPAGYLHFSFVKRQEGVRAAAARRKLELESVDYRPDDLSDLVRFLRAAFRPATAVVAFDHLVARQVFDLMNGMKRVAGRDYGLVSCDSDSRTDAYWPALSRVGFDRYRMGAMAADRMLISLGEREGSLASGEFRGAWIPGETAKHVDINNRT